MDNGAFTPISVLEAVRRSPGGDVEELALTCLDLTWNQVFLELDRLSRSGAVSLRQQRPGRYSVSPL